MAPGKTLLSKDKFSATFSINSSPLSATYICVSESGRIGSDNGLSPIWRQAIIQTKAKSPIWRQAIIQTNAKSPIWRQAIIQTNANLLTIGPLGTNFSEILVKIQKIFIHEKCIWKYCLWNGGHFVQEEMG